MTEQITKSNPFDWIHPVRSKDLFAGRTEEIAKIMEELLKLEGDSPGSPSVAIVGARRVGKTSLLWRLREKCKEQSLASLLITIDDRIALDVWEFWREIFEGLLSMTSELGISKVTAETHSLGFGRNDPPFDVSKTLLLNQLTFVSLYKSHLLAPQSVGLSYQAIKNDLDIFKDKFRNVGSKGIVLMLDEAHNLINARDVKQQLRNIMQQISGFGIVFAGETTLVRLFTDTSEPFFGQAYVIRVNNFVKSDEITECVLLPLDEAELKLVSPMTISYIAKLSRGKPNQIRLICSSIYKRFMRGLQKDLDITIDVLDDILDDISEAYSDTGLRDSVRTIQKLDSVDLEILHNMTRYPEWKVEDIIAVDESFRGESKSELAIKRRRLMLEEKRRQFVEMHLMEQHDTLYQLSGGEFLALYLRFVYQTRKYGNLPKQLIIGQGPPTLFGEITDKLVRAIVYNFGRALELNRLISHESHRDFGLIIDKVKRRFAVLEDLKKGKKPEGVDAKELLLECLSVCELIEKEGEYFLVCLSVRNRENPRELIQVELYFDFGDGYSIDLAGLFNLVTKQAEQARVVIEGYQGFSVKLPDLPGLLQARGVTLDELLKKLPLTSKWWVSSVQHAITSRNQTDVKEAQGQNEDNEAEKNSHEWIQLYAKGDIENADNYLVERISKTTARDERARMYNDLGYIRSGKVGLHMNLAYKDLEMALDLHSSHIQLTLLNLAYLDIKNEQFEKAITRIETALFLSLNPTHLDASYLRVLTPESRQGFKNNWEQHPANLIEAAYANLAYALVKYGKVDDAHETLQEGLEIMPSSVRLKHSLARLYLYTKDAQPAYSIFTELAGSQVRADPALEREIRYFSAVSRRGRSKSTRRNKK